MNAEERGISVAMMGELFRVVLAPEQCLDHSKISATLESVMPRFTLLFTLWRKYTKPGSTYLPSRGLIPSHSKVWILELLNNLME